MSVDMAPDVPSMNVMGGERIYLQKASPYQQLFNPFIIILRLCRSSSIKVPANLTIIIETRALL